MPRYLTSAESLVKQNGAIYALGTPDKDKDIELKQFGDAFSEIG